jgi:hypothetical protein
VLLAAAKYDEAMQEVHRVMVAAQESVYEYEGSISRCSWTTKVHCAASLLHCVVQLLFS